MWLRFRHSENLFERFLLPCAYLFLAQVEQQANLPFYRSLAILSREILAAMADELMKRKRNNHKQKSALRDLICSQKLD